jgi:hypothetical protein
LGADDRERQAMGAVSDRDDGDQGGFARGAEPGAVGREVGVVVDEAHTEFDDRVPQLDRTGFDDPEARSCGACRFVESWDESRGAVGGVGVAESGRVAERGALVRRAHHYDAGQAQQHCGWRRGDDAGEFGFGGLELFFVFTHRATSARRMRASVARSGFGNANTIRAASTTCAALVRVMLRTPRRCT